MIQVQVGELAKARAGALIRPVDTEFAPVTAAMRRFDEAAGPAVAEQCTRLGELPLASAVITAAGALPAQFVVHVAVRSRTENATAGVVRRGLRNALHRLVDWDIREVALVPLGTGAGNLDAEESAAVMVPILRDHMRELGAPTAVTIVVEDEYQRSAFEAALTRDGGEPTGTGA
ncbi:MAG: macro domain-containing protein [Gemmatimonadota bacterium]